MENLFNYNNKVFTTMAKITDSILLGLLWLLCSIPIITIGASSAAFYYAYTKCIRQDRGYIGEAFFHGFKTSFKYATVSWLVQIIVGAIVLIDCVLLTTMGGFSPISGVLLAIVIIVLVVSVLLALLLFPYIARYENTLKESIKNCVLILFSNFLWAVLLLILLCVTVFVAACFPVLVIILPSVYMFFANKILEHVFQKYMRPDDLEVQKQFEQ